MKFSRGNTKIGKDTLIFNMGTSTDCISKKLNLCDNKHICYAFKSERQYKSVLPYRRLQSDLWISESINKISDDIKVYLNKKLKIPIKYIRFNESGDFKSQSDINKLCDLALLLPEITFYGYTHRIDLMYNNLPDNLIINGSGFMINNNFKTIDKSDIKDYKYICGGDCKNCDLCKIKDNKIIGVIKH